MQLGFTVLTILAGLLIVSAERQTFEGYKTYRFLVSNKTEARSFISSVNVVAEKYQLDVWASNAVEGWIDVMIQPEVQPLVSTLFPNVPYTIAIGDVQASIDQNEQERLLLRKEDDIFSDFQRYATILAWILEQAQLHSNVAEVFSIGQTYQGTDIWALRIGAGGNKKLVYWQCGIHAREWITPTNCLWFINQLLNEDPAGPALVAEFEFVIVPVLNVDGYEYTHTTNRLWRKNRVPNPGSTCVGTDLNRNYGYNWGTPGGSGNPCSETFWGARPFSSPESDASRSEVEKNINRIVNFWDFHSYGSLWVSPWGYTGALPPDYGIMNAAMQAAINALRQVNGRTYAFGTSYNVVYQTSGSSPDFAYGTAGIPLSFTTEAFGSNFTPSPSFIQPIGDEIWAGVKATLRLLYSHSTNKSKN